MIVKSVANGGTIQIISSKSELHRLMLISAVSSSSVKIEYSSSLSDDVIATANCINAVGGRVEFFDGYVIVNPIIPATSSVQVCPNESGSTLRFILPIYSALGLDYTVTVNGRLSSRPLSPLYEIMQANGVSLSENGVYPLSVKGTLSANEFEIDGSVSSQFISGLLMSIPLIANRGKVVVTGDFQSQSYVDLTIDAMQKFGAIVTKTDRTYEVKCDKYISNSNLKAGGDWSNGAFGLVCGALSEIGVKVQGLDENSKQGDKKILDVIKQIGAKITIENDGIMVKKGKLLPIEIDVGDIPDLVPIIAVICSVCSGTSKIKNVHRLRLKESDRVQSVISMINALGGDAYEKDDCIYVNGKPRLVGGIVDSYNDHRIVMASAIASVVCDGEVEIINASAVTKSYPNFFEEFKKIGILAKEE